ncbi:unnamed protein product, partial [Cyprideis torosa]
MTFPGDDNMAENETAAVGDAPQQPKLHIMAQFVRDMSFENILSQKGASEDPQPEVSVRVNLDAKKRQTENQYEVSLKLAVDSKDKNG